MTLKQELYLKCQDFLNQRLLVIQNSIRDIQNAFESETKSSAGDKHETGRAMLQLEREKAGHQLAETEKLIELLNKIEPRSTSEKIGLGSLVYTSKGNYFIAISAGAFELQGSKFYAISLSTPMAKLLLSKNVGETGVFREEEIKVIDIQ